MALRISSAKISVAPFTPLTSNFVKKKYLNLNYTLPLADDQSLNFDLNYYKSDDDGKKIAGEIDSKIWSLAAAFPQAHTL